jgi:hypothetical protein
MKKLPFTIVMYLLYAIFFVLYSLSPVRNFFLSLNAAWLNGVYGNLDAFFNFIWERSLGTFVNATGSSSSNPALYGAILIFLAVTLLVVIVDILIGIHQRRHRVKIKTLNQAMVEEQAQLSDTNQAPATFSDLNTNQGNFANTSAPYVSLDAALSKAEDNGQGSVKIRSSRPRPAVRIALTIIFGIIVLLWLFIRFVWQSKWPSAYSVFQGLFSWQFYNQWMTDLDNFFSHFLSNIYQVQLASIQGNPWTWGQLVELLLLLLLCALVWAVFLLICHAIVVHKRQNKRQKAKIELYGDKELSANAKSVLGNADLAETKLSGDITSIAVLTPHPSSVEREKQTYEKADYIDDISTQVKNAGTSVSTASRIQPSPIRQPLLPEETGDDLSGNKAVTISDIASIEDSIKKDKETVPIETFIMPEEGTPKVDLASIDIDQVARLSDKMPVTPAFSSGQDDMIAFDEDGYAYLVKEGKPFKDYEEDISDVITAENLDKTAAIARFGRKYYDILDELEPFHLRSLDYDEEIQSIKTRQRQGELLYAEELLKESLSKEPFTLYEPEAYKEADTSQATEEIKPESTVSIETEPQTIVEPAVEPVKEEPNQTEPEEKETEKAAPEAEHLKQEGAPQPVEKPAEPIQAEPVKPEGFTKPAQPLSPSHVSAQAFVSSEPVNKNPATKKPIPAPDAKREAPKDIKPVEPRPLTSASGVLSPNQPKPAPVAPLTFKPVTVPSAKPTKAIAPVDIQHVGMNSAASLDPYKTTGSFAQTEDKNPSPLKPSVPLKPVAPVIQPVKKPVVKPAPVKPFKKDISKLKPEDLLSHKPSAPVGPVAPHVVSIEDFLGKKEKK